MPTSVVIIGSAHPLRGGGLSTFNERLARECMHQGYQTSIVTFSLQYPNFLFPGTTQYSDEPAPTDLKISVAINTVNPLNWLKVGRQIKKLRPDIVVVRYWIPFMGPCLGTILRIIKKNKHTQIVCIADNIIPHEKRIGDTLFTKYFIKPVDRFIVMSEQVLADLKTFTQQQPTQFITHPLYDNFGEKITKEAARAALGITNNDKIVLFFGFIRKYKGVDMLLDAINIIKKQQNKVPFKVLIAGEFYEDRQPFDTQIAELLLADYLILKTDFIPDYQVRNYFCAADVVIQPYRNATQSGVTPLAYHFEIPMIVTNVGGLPSLVPHEKIGLVTAPNPTAIAESLLAFFKYDAQYFIDNIKQAKPALSWQNLVNAIVHPNQKNDLA
ncbi:glycosyltransferase [Ferruginibacter yonginensis]|uniref:Glycosyltransferase n=1 Tax=Ferruginibacter yonginensis TaxID=1310416 RepID=A0ABV8QP20_9BACT